jgi:hypothetical protein
MLNPMTTFKLPASGEELAYAAKEYAGQTYEKVRDSLEWQYLPRALDAIWSNSPLLKDLRKAAAKPELATREICHIIVTFPGLTAVERIREVLLESQLVKNSDGEFETAQEIASELFNLTMRYTRVQNLARHIRTAVNSHLKVLGIEVSRSGSSYENSLSKLDLSGIPRERVLSLRSANLKSISDVNDWADDVNSLLSLSSSRGVLTSKRLEQSIRPRREMAASAINTYRLRFKQALAATLGIELASESSRIEKTSNKTIDGLLSELDELPKDPSELYQMLINLRPKRISRPDIRSGEFVYEIKTSASDTSRKNLLKHVFNLEGREVVIMGSRSAFTDEMVTGVMKTVSIQLSLNSDSRALQAAFESRGQVLRVEIERPKKSDHKQLAEIFRQLI